MIDVFVTGGTGYMGQRLIPELLARGHRVRVLTRAGSVGRVPKGAEAVTGNALDAGSYAPSLAPDDTLVPWRSTHHRGAGYHCRMILGLRTTIYQVPDLAKAKAWYASAFGVEPYFDQPFYVGFNIGGYELGLNPDVTAVRPGPGGALAYWGVDDIHAAVHGFVSAGARVTEPAHDVGEGIKVATVADPFGNLIGLIENPHFKLPA